MTNTNLSISIVSDLSEFRSLAGVWNELASENPLLSWDWMYSWWEAYQAGNDLLIFVARDENDQVVGLVPLFKTITRSGARVIRGIGSGAACSDYFQVICAAENRVQVEIALANSIFNSPDVRRRLARWDWIELDGHDGTAFVEFFAAMSARSCQTHQSELESSWGTDLLTPFEEFEATLKKSFRRKTRKARKNLANPRVRFDVLDEVAELKTAWSSFCDLHQLRRNMLGQAGCFADDRFEKFLLQASSRLMENGQAGLARAQVDGKDIGFVLMFQTKTTYWKYQSGMDPDASSWEPGHLMTTALIEQAINEGCTTYDFLRGDEPYKKFWNSQRRPLYRTKIVAPRASSKLRHGIWLAGRSIKQGLESFRNSPAS